MLVAPFIPVGQTYYFVDQSNITFIFINKVHISLQHKHICGSTDVYTIIYTKGYFVAHWYDHQDLGLTGPDAGTNPEEFTEKPKKGDSMLSR